MTRSPITSPLSGDAQEITARVLQDSLVDLVALALVAKQAHWNVIGRNFRSVHLQLDELVNLARLQADRVAERAATIGNTPDGRPATVAESTTMPEFAAGWQNDEQVTKAIAATLQALMSKFRIHIQQTERTDPVTQGLLIEITSMLEEAHWMWQAQLT